MFTASVDFQGHSNSEEHGISLRVMKMSSQYLLSLRLAVMRLLGRVGKLRTSAAASPEEWSVLEPGICGLMQMPGRGPQMPGPRSRPVVIRPRGEECGLIRRPGSQSP